MNYQVINKIWPVSLAQIKRYAGLPPELNKGSNFDALFAQRKIMIADFLEKRKNYLFLVCSWSKTEFFRSTIICSMFLVDRKGLANYDE